MFQESTPLYASSNDKRSVCVACYVFGSYEVFIPFYIYSVLKSYPNYSCYVFVDDPLSHNVLQALEIIEAEISNNFKIIELNSDDLPTSTEVLSKSKYPHAKPALRWFINENYFQGFDYVYIGDIDFFIVPEKPALSQQHIDSMKLTGLPFSNAVRKEDRLTGLHFFETDIYFSKIKSHCYFYDSAKLETEFDEFDKVGVDERVLYKILDESFNENIREKLTNFRPYHGFHLAALRSPLSLLKEDTRHGSKKAKNSHNTYNRNTLLKAVKSLYIDDPIFWKIKKVNSHISVSRLAILAKPKLRYYQKLFPIYIKECLVEVINKVRKKFN
ncbi:hypothetical protein LCW13_10855 [Cobetia amphilecti]|uniref:hypothetical protein n=1 Tax=Cobetia amphilecti TaxID=1055104 RepID=UPI001CDAB632|nr:hypothetical protein [Cobetia amphilecti]UBU47561.1 hypothetical protein LCW13_10855 [Cobetia amphilecti]